MGPRYSLANRKANELLQAGKVKQPPVPVEKLARQVGAVVRYEPFVGQMSGMVRRQPKGRTIIGVNSLHSLSRRRFTIGHELGHLLLHKDEDLHVDEKSPIRFRSEISSLAVDDNEIEANQFAAELLMPIYLLTKEIEKLPSKIETEEAIAHLADRFQVSEQAMTFRLSRLRVLR